MTRFSNDPLLNSLNKLDESVEVNKEEKETLQEVVVAKKKRATIKEVVEKNVDKTEIKESEEEGELNYGN